MINNKQYIIMDRPFQQKDFVGVTLTSGKILSYHQNLPVQIKLQDDIAKYCLLGYAYQTDANRKTPIEELDQIANEQDIHDAIESWTGSWLLIYEDRLYMDACGTLGCFYTKEGIISRSIHCINQAMNRKDCNPRITHRFGLDYFPGPDTPYTDVKRLMPSQTLGIRDCSLGKRIMTPSVQGFDTDEQRIEALISAFSTMLTYIEKDYAGRIWVPLTGGYDSRTYVALLEYCNITNYTLFTMEHDNITEEDKEVPPQIAKLLGREYRYISRGLQCQRKRYREFDAHCGRMAIDEDRNFYAYGQYPELEGGYALLRANIWEIAWGKYYKTISSYGPELSKFKKKYVNVRRRKDIQDSLAKWFEYIKSDEQKLPFANRFYWEQRVGCWLSSVEQSLTIMDGVDSIPLCNCNRLLSILLDFDIEKRMNKEYQVMIIEKTCPELLDIPFLHGKQVKTKSRLSTELQYAGNCFRCLNFVEAVKEERRHLIQLLRTRKGK